MREKFHILGWLSGSHTVDYKSAQAIAKQRRRPVSSDARRKHPAQDEWSSNLADEQIRQLRAVAEST